MRSGRGQPAGGRGAEMAAPPGAAASGSAAREGSHRRLEAPLPSATRGPKLFAAALASHDWENALCAREMAASALMNVMIGAARKAGRGLARDFGEIEQLQVSVKGPGNFV